MKIRTKITILIAALLVVMLFLVYTQYLVEQNRTKSLIEGISTSQQEFFGSLVELSSSGLSSFASDYSYWDDMVEFVSHPESKFGEENIPASLPIFKADEVFVYNTDFKSVYGVDIRYAQAIPPDLPVDFFENIMEKRRAHFFVEKNGILTEFSAATIHPTADPERKTEPRGIFLVGKRWDANYIVTLEKLSGMKVSFDDISTIEMDPGSISFPYNVYGLNGEIVKSLTVTTFVPVFNQAQQSSQNQLLLIIGSSFLFLLLVYIFLEIIIGRPIAILSSSIEKKDIHLLKDLQHDRSEFGTLAKVVLGFSEHELVLQGKAKDDAILSAVGSGLIVIDTNKHITLINAAAKELFDISESVIGSSVDEVFKASRRDGEFISNQDYPLARALAEKKSILETVRCIKSDGSYFPAIITAAPVVLGGKIIGAVQDIRDVSSEEAIEHAKNDFVALVSHELRTPLTLLRWSIETMQSSTNLSKEAADAVLLPMSAAIKRMQTLIAAMLDVSKIETKSFMTTPTRVNFSSLIDSTLGELRPSIDEKHIQVSVNTPANNMNTVQSDERLLRIIVSNLLSNAVRYCNNEGKIDITMDGGENELVMSIKNTGLGIPLEDQPNIFKKMFRASNASIINPDGIGLGLYVSKSFLERLGGSLSFSSQPNIETVFTVKLPRIAKNS
jgi:PAS domain S-box-containing protein